MIGELTKRAGRDEGAVRGCLNVLEKVFRHSSLLPFAVRLWDGSEWRNGEAKPTFTLEFKHPAALRKLFWGANQVSMGEAYIYDDFDIKGDVEASFNLADFLLKGAKMGLKEKLQIVRQLLPLPIRNYSLARQFSAQLKGTIHSRRRDAAAVQYHYNVSNEFYRLWLDPQMVYSCAFFHDPCEELEVAQQRKLDYICRKLRLKPGETLLDIGCGWGGLMLHAATNYGVEVTGVTLSEPQADLANQRFRDAGVADRCRAEVMDYRDVCGSESFDKLVSVGMFEHVGEAQLPVYFQKAYSLLKPGGVFLNHGITETWKRHGNNDESFVEKYVFPDGELLPIATILQIAAEAGFEVRDVESLREHYALTLRRWVKRLEQNQEQAVQLTSPVTYRIWRIYMAGSAYGFTNGTLNLYQALLIKAGRRASGLPLTRCDWYRPCPSGYH
ncbi:MAG: class I SAM-dependent methyltransferase [Deltaproteobacteria bacterium]|jgi:cyclopropane-fatty-acyl-phospholipid synthase|nr:class I SAM-dependent methyltransferase [Deltaproteobacteria bacterium]